MPVFRHVSRVATGRALLLALLPLGAGCSFAAEGTVPFERPSPEGGAVPPATPESAGGAGDVESVPPDEIADAVPRPEVKSRYGNPESYEELGKRYHVLDTSEGYVQRGIASWYGEPFQGRRTSSGETYDMYAMTAAHPTLPLPTYVEVTNLENGRRAVVRVNDRGPFHEERVIDLSYAAARKLDMLRAGTARVEIRALSPPARDPES